MSTLAAVEFANSAFYDAFSAASIDQMSDVWSAADTVFSRSAKYSCTVAPPVRVSLPATSTPLAA